MNSRPRTFIIAEAGVNHNGSLELALKLVDRAARAGADAVKFQTFTAESLVLKSASRAAYQARNTGQEGSQYDMLKALELGPEDHRALLARCREAGVEFMSSAFDAESLRFLADLGMKTFKIPSGEITNLPYLRAVGRLGGRALLSTGMSALGEVEAAIEILEESGTPRSRITVLQCTSEYPAPLADVNLLAMKTMARAFGVEAGFSDHTEGMEAAVAAAALGARVIEKHFTLDRSMEGPDHKASIDPEGLAALVRAVRNVELALGDGLKRPSRGESATRPLVRKSIVAARPIKQGAIIVEEDLTAKRPGCYTSPMEWDRVVGSAAERDFEPDEPL